MRLKQLTFDSLFSFCNVLERIGAEELLQSFITIGETEDSGQAAVQVLVKLLLKKLPVAKDDIFIFLAEVTETDDGKTVKPKELAKMPIGEVIPYMKGIFESEEIRDFFGQAVSLMGMDTTKPLTASAGDTGEGLKA